MREWIGLTAKATANAGGNDTYMGHWQFQDLAYLAVNVMRCLRRSPQGHFAANGIAGVGFPTCDTGVRFKRCVVVAFVVEPVFTDVVRRGKTRLHIAKFVRDGFVDIAGTRFVVDFHLWMCKSLVDAHESRQYLVFHFDELHGLVKNIGIQRGNGGNRVAYVADFVDSQGILILTGRKDTKLLRQIFACQNGQHPWQLQSFARIDGKNACMGMGRTQQSSIDHARQHYVISIQRAPGYFAIGINLGPGSTDNTIRASLVLLLATLLMLTHELLTSLSTSATTLGRCGRLASLSRCAR